MVGLVERKVMKDYDELYGFHVLDYLEDAKEEALKEAKSGPVKKLTREEIAALNLVHKPSVDLAKATEFTSYLDSNELKRKARIASEEVLREEMHI